MRLDPFEVLLHGGARTGERRRDAAKRAAPGERQHERDHGVDDEDDQRREPSVDQLGQEQDEERREQRDAEHAEHGRADEEPDGPADAPHDVVRFLARRVRLSRRELAKIRDEHPHEPREGFVAKAVAPTGACLHSSPRFPIRGRCA
jgi:hypothetical protein